MFRNYDEFNKEQPKERIFSLYFFVIAFIISIVAFLSFLDNNKEYHSEISIILIPKSEKAASDSEHIVENLKVLPTKLSFYNKLVRDENIKDDLSGLPDDQRRAMWNNDLQITREEGSSIITIDVIKEDSTEAKMLSKAVTANLLNIAGFYYDIKSDIDIRIIESPIVYSAFDNWASIILLSLATGFLISFLVNSVLCLFFGYFQRKKDGLRKRFKETTWKKKDNLIKESGKLSEEKILPEKKIIPEKKQEEKPLPSPVAKIPQKGASAPENLPFVDEEYFRNNIIKNSGLAAKETPAEKPLVYAPEEVKKEEPELYREPTREEFKKRLNQLLRGEL